MNKICPFLVLLIISGIFFVSCDKNELADYELPIRSELPLYSYTIDTLKYESKKDYLKELVNSDPFVIRSENELQAFFDEMDELSDTNALKALPEYTSFDFSKHTVILKLFYQIYHPEKLIRTESHFFSKGYLSDQFIAEGYSYYYNLVCSFEAHQLDNDGFFLSVSGIVVDKIPANEKVTSVVSFGLTPSKE